MGLEEECMQGLEARRFAELIGGAKHVHAISNAFDGNAAAAKPFDVEKAQG
ncbi:hypothetical protein [Sinorhizobium alkalisoli]|uniref:hypothetical protein n=1 Tax=Sinorhizobium alkalisoli TaxID=1752398 RepID=UPI001A9629EF|nr:hypothetical protein [Sinorhizobium alkalisoli]